MMDFVDGMDAVDGMDRMDGMDNMDSPGTPDWSGPSDSTHSRRSAFGTHQRLLSRLVERRDDILFRALRIPVIAGPHQRCLCQLVIERLIREAMVDGALGFSTAPLTMVGATMTLTAIASSYSSDQLSTGAVWNLRPAA